MGLFVVPIYSDGEEPGTEYLQVATSMPELPLLGTEDSKHSSKRRLVALSPVVKPVKRL